MTVILCESLSLAYPGSEKGKEREVENLPDGQTPENGPFVVLDSLANGEVVLEVDVLGGIVDDALVVDSRDRTGQIDRGNTIMRIGARAIVDLHGLLLFRRRHGG